MNTKSIRKRGGPEKAAPFRLLTNPARDAGFFYLASGVFLKFRVTDGSSVAIFLCISEFKNQCKTVGVARQQLHFLCSDKENEAKESLALRWACLVRKVCNINTGCSD